MVFALARRLALGAVVAGTIACSQSAAAPAPGADSGAPGMGESVAFDAQGVLTTMPRGSVDVGFHLTGEDAVVSIRLDGDYADASLSAGVVSTSGGHGSVTLHAPAVPATFAIVAHAAGGPDARLDVAVSASGFATIRVVPRYTGKRPADLVTASVFVKTTCADLAAAFASGQFQDGTPASSGALAMPLPLPTVPAGAHVAVVARIKQYANGCVDLDTLAADTARDVEVMMLNRPMALGAIDLVSGLSFQPDATQATAWTQMLDGAIARAGGAFVPSSASESTAILQAMRSLVPASGRAAFDAASTQYGWDARTTMWLAQHPPTMRSRALAWLNAGKPDALGTLALDILATPMPGYATFALKSYAGLDAAAIGMSVSTPASISADADDVLHMAATLHLWSTALVCETADARARMAVTGSTDSASALAMQIDCTGLASALVGTGVSYPACDAACTALLCKSALVAMWKNAHDASAVSADDSMIDMTVSAQATIADDASPAQFIGAWVGQVTSSQSSYAPFGIKGSAQGAETTIPR
jgi:hypothetical protein